MKKNIIRLIIKIMTTILQICFVTGIFVCFLAVLTQARYKAIIAFIICWFGFPNHVTHLIDIGGLPLFFFGEIAITLALCLVILIYYFQCLRHNIDYL